MTRLEAIGYWFNDAAPSACPRPQRLVGGWRGSQRARVIAYLRAGDMLASYRASSFCRFACGMRARDMGHCDLTDGVWVWPEGLAHYVEAHRVRLPDRFVRHVIAARGPRAPLPRWSPRDRVGLVDDARWLAWGRAQGATPALAGWAVPGWAQQRALAARLARVTPRVDGTARAPATIVLARADRVVLALATGELAIIGLATGRTRVVAGWDAWPIAGRG